MTSDKKAIEAAKTLSQYCEEQQGCQNCIFRKYGAEHWRCEVQALEIRNILANKEAKRKKHGFID
jgi:hypothetical protein